MKKILVVGSINEDITLHMKKLPLPGETVIANDFDTSLGGKGCNQAVAAARIGGEVSFIGAVGSKKSDDEILELLEKDGINTSGIARLETNTGSAYITIDEDAENSIIVYPGANFEITKDHLHANEELFIESDYCLLQLEVPMDIIRETLKLCDKHGVKVILNPAPYNDDVDDEILSKVDFYIPNQTEFLQTVKADTQTEYDIDWYITEGEKFAAKHNLSLVITLGKDGSILIKDNGVVRIPVFKTTAVDTTAAGDSFIGGFLATLSKGESIVDSLTKGSKVASITISRKGAIKAIPHLSEL